MDKKIIEAVESLTEEQLTLFLAYLLDIEDSREGLPYSDRRENQ